MKFLQAKRIVAALDPNLPKEPLCLACSFQSEPLELFLQAQCAEAGLAVEVRHLPFAGLQTYLFQPEPIKHATILCPWDFLPELDWRLGYEGAALAFDEAIPRIDEAATRMRNQFDAVVYLAAPGKPVFATASQQQAAESAILAKLVAHYPNLTIRSDFDLAQYQTTGQPIANRVIGDLCGELALQLAKPTPDKKVLVTDLDHTLWHGVIGEDGVDGIFGHAEGAGYPHFIYQTLLKSLKQRGVLLAIASKNDDDLARAPLKNQALAVSEDDFVAIEAHYQPKSTTIAALATHLNLPLDAFVFVDDNPVEREEVKAALPAVTCLAFSPELPALGELQQALMTLFPSQSLSSEDDQRTEMYRTRMQSSAALKSAGADIGEFLQGLKMTLTIREVTDGGHERALQLLNKTNQFNANGHRLSEQDLRDAIKSGGRFFSAQLADRYGDHGEILSGLIQGNCLTHWAMSCRVMNRRVEFGFLGALFSRLGALSANYQPTDRNSPFSDFLNQLNGQVPDKGHCLLSAEEAQARSKDLFVIQWLTNA